MYAAVVNIIDTQGDEGVEFTAFQSYEQIDADTARRLEEACYHDKIEYED